MKPIAMSLEFIKNLKKVIILVGAIIASPVLHGAQSHPEKLEAKNSYQELLKLSNQNAIYLNLSELDKKNNWVVREELFFLLMQGMRSKQKLTEFTSKSSKVKHDLSLEAGRAAFILEILLDETIPPITKGSNEKSISMSVNEALKKIKIVIAEHKNNIDDLVYVESLSINERLDLAKNSAISARMMKKLSSDPEIPVRKAVAANPNTSVHDLINIAKHDSDQGVRETATKNLKYSRSFEYFKSEEY